MFCLLLIILLVSICYEANAQHVTLMELNCENAFDLRHDEGKNDFEYVDGGTRHWNNGKLYRKLDGVAKIIAAVDSVQPVGIVGLCEVENDSVLEYLTKRTVLRSMGYEYIVTESEDSRGIDVAMLYSALVFRPFEKECIRPKHVGSATRDILRVAGVMKRDTLDVYIVHLPSKLGGKEGKLKASQILRGLKMNVDSIMACRRDAKIIVMGDMNSELNSEMFRKDLPVERFWKSNEKGLLDGTALYDVIEEKAGKAFGTYKYRGVWSVIDHIFVTGNMNVVESGILSSSYIVEKDDKYGGIKPKRTYIGYRYNGGISDHLPVWVRIGL